MVYVSVLFVLHILSQCHQSKVILWVCPCLGVTYQVDCVLLCLQSGRQVVAIPHVVAVVNAGNKHITLHQATVCVASP